MDLHGQRVIILGGTSGIGLATAKAAARCGAEVSVTSRRQSSVDRGLAELPPGARGRAADLTNPALVCPLFDDLTLQPRRRWLLNRERKRSCRKNC
jgi:NAD(P)-dependent dehydrogenase (short-subunit alcohol dehydrogenase family)